MSLTGDPLSDALIPIAQRLIAAVRDADVETVDQCVADAIVATGGKCDPGTGLAVVLAAMVPDHYRPSQLLAWIPDHMRHPVANPGPHTRETPANGRQMTVKKEEPR